jgi:hypothetical protein
MDEWIGGWMDRQIDIQKTDRRTNGWMDGRKNGVITGWIVDGWRKRTTDGPVIIFRNNLIIIFLL